jgi:hypothetical protein|tara:strand:+ start:508 stop:735 length:228 start_codon:yes stop_codon:yes gene_type:complete
VIKINLVFLSSQPQIFKSGIDMFKIITICFFLSTLVKGADPDGFPEVNRAVRAKEATNKLNDRKQMALIFVKGMT